MRYKIKSIYSIIQINKNDQTILLIHTKNNNSSNNTITKPQIPSVGEVAQAIDLSKATSIHKDYH